MKLRNAENDPLVLDRVTLTLKASAATTAGPARTGFPAS
jgi:hypothetical protein